MVNADREIERSRKLIKRSRELHRRLENVSQMLDEAGEESRRNLTALYWRKFFDYDETAEQFYSNLDEEAKERLRPKD